MRQNLAGWDRIARIALLAVLVPLGVWVIGGVAGIAIAAVGLIMGATGSVGYCPIEQATGIESKPQDEAVRRGA
jgi:hypothetical protein